MEPWEVKGKLFLTKVSMTENPAKAPLPGVGSPPWGGLPSLGWRLPVSWLETDCSLIWLVGSQGRRWGLTGSAGVSGVPRYVGGLRGGVGRARAWCLAGL